MLLDGDKPPRSMGRQVEFRHYRGIRIRNRIQFGSCHRVWFVELNRRWFVWFLDDLAVGQRDWLVELGWGLMISAFAKTQMQALLICFAVIMVMVIFSGYAFPVDTMPPLMQAIANIFPLKHWLIIFRGILLKGAGIQDFFPELIAISVLGIIIYTFTIILLRRNKLE